MLLKDREISAIAGKIRDSILEIQNKQHEQMCEDYKNSSEFKALLINLKDFVENTRKNVKDMPEILRPDGVRFGNFYIRLDEHSEEDCKDLLMTNFNKKHVYVAVPYCDIQREVILAAIDDKSVDSMIDKIVEQFSKKKLIE